MRFLYSSLIVLLFASCGGSNKPDVSGISAELNVVRFEKAFFSIDTTQLPASLTRLNSQFPRFFPLFMNDLMELPVNTNVQQTGGALQLSPRDEAIIRSFFAFNRPLNDSVQKKYANFDRIEKRLEEAFRYVKHYFPSYVLPEVYTYVADFSFPGIVYSPKYLAIGLQQFAGKAFTVYDVEEVRQMYPAYITRRFDEEYIPVRAMEGVILNELYPGNFESGRLIESMIEKGKQWYLLSRFLPDVHDSLITGYTGAQQAFIRENEGNIWSEILKATPDIYTMDSERMQNYLGESPRTLDMPDAVPGNIGQWVGWRIVEKFAADQPKLTLQQLLQTPPAKLFAEAKYKPK